MIFETSVQGVRCKCEVIDYTPESPMVITGSGFGDAIEGDQEEFTFRILGIENNRRMRGLEELVTPAVRQKLINEYKERMLDF